MSSVKSETTDLTTEQLVPLSLALPSDPLLDSQFNLNNTGQTGGLAGIDINVFPVWEDYRGAGVTVGIIDDGVEHTHPDLNANYDTSIDNDSRDGDADAMAIGADRHGTAVAGIIAADDNALGGTGVAPDASIAGFRMGFGADGTLQQITENIALQVNVDVSNNSWGFGGFFGDNFKSSAFRAHASALEDTVELGRDGLGTVWVFAAGNSRTSGDDVNYHNFQNSRYTIAVAAAEDDGDVTFYSTPGASIITTAPVAAGGGLGGVITTDRTGSAGYASGDFTFGFNGTSAATPMVSGVIALILEANPELGYRDVQEILAYSSRQIDASDPGWALNAAGDWNGGGLHVSHDFGYGLIDAHAAVRLAESWQKLSTFANEQTVGAGRTPILGIVDNATVNDQITITDPIDLQWVEIDILIDHSYIGDLVITLTSPDGTTSTLVNRPGKSASSTWGTSQDDINFVLTSSQFWGEDGTGTWTLSVSDHFQADSGTLLFWNLNLYGDALTADDDYIYTDEYGVFAASDPRRGTLTDAGGTDRINAAALTGAALIDLNAGAGGLLAGQSFTIAEGTLIEDAIAGDGNDTLTGNLAANDLDGARGDDLLAGGAGDDTLTGGAGSDTFSYLSGDGLDTITDFDVALDTIRLDGVGGITDLGSFVGAGRQVDGNFQVEFGEGNGLTLLGVLIEDLVGDFLELLNVPEPDPEPIGPLAFLGSEAAETVTGTAFSDTLRGQGGDDSISGGDSDDTLLGESGADSLTGDAGGDRVGGGDGNDTVMGGPGDDVITGDGGDDSLFAEAGDDRVYGGDGDDVLDGADGLDILFGGDGGDMISGGADSDTLGGDAGEDTLLGDAGADRLDAGDGDDSVLGGIGDDLILGDSGLDTLKGDDGNDLIYGGIDPDTLMGLEGDDFLRGDEGDDRVAGGNGADTVVGNDGADVLTGDDGNDSVDGGLGDDRIYGGDGLDSVFGGDGIDTIQGGSGTDLIEGGAGDDSLLGEDGSDEIYGDAGLDTLRGGIGDDAMFGGAGSDTMLGDADDDTLMGGEDGDRLAGGDGQDSVLGETGDDVLTGDGGQDTLRGGDGADLLIGGGDDDTLLGDAGADRLLGSEGNDRILGGDGDDLIEGGAGNDVMTGGADRDRFVFSASENGDHDTVTDFQTGTDTLVLAGLSISSLDVSDLNGDAVADTRVTFDSGAVLDLLGVSGATIDDII